MDKLHGAYFTQQFLSVTSLCTLVPEFAAVRAGHVRSNFVNFAAYSWSSLRFSSILRRFLICWPPGTSSATSVTTSIWVGCGLRFFNEQAFARLRRHRRKSNNFTGVADSNEDTDALDYHCEEQVSGRNLEELVHRESKHFLHRCWLKRLVLLSDRTTQILYCIVFCTR